MAERASPMKRHDAGGVVPVSVLIGAFNAAPYLGEAIDSILNQSQPRIELVVVDDGSEDGTAEVAKSYGDSLVYVRQENSGEGAARNTAVRNAHGEILAFMDADDRSVPDRLALQLAVLESDPELDAVFGHVREFISPELTDEQRARLSGPRETSPWITVSAMMVRREAFARVGPFSESLLIGANLDWCARAVDVGLRTTMLAEVLIERRLHLTNLGLLQRDARPQYVDIVKAALARRRALRSESAPEG